MKKGTKVLITILVAALLLLPGLGVGADEGTNFGDRLGYHPETGKVSYIGTDPGQSIAVAGADSPGMLTQDRTRAVMEVYAPLFGETNPGENMLQTSISEGRRGQTTARYQQTYRGIPVFAGELLVNLDEQGKLLSMVGELSPDLALPVEPEVTSGIAALTALEVTVKNYGGETADYSTSEPELWIYDPRLLEPSDMPQSLVWRMEVSGHGEVPVRALVLVDAQYGWVSLQFNQIDTIWSKDLLGSGDTGEYLVRQETPNQFSGTVPRATYDANDNFILPGTLLCDQSDPTCIGAGGDLDAVLAHQYAGDSFVFYYDVHGRNSLNDAGMTLVSSVHYRPSDATSQPYANAGWNGAQMIYGDAYGYARADDVVGHELTHGVTQFTSNLLYYSQSGAINESFSDLWGEFIDLTNSAGTDTSGVRWLLGEDITGYGAIRSMSNPTAYGDPDKMTSPYYYLGYGDNSGVHYNSGVNNKAVYLMVDGGSFNGQTISGIGLDKVAAIYYDAQTTLLTSGSDYLNLYYAVRQACTNLIGGAEGITAGDCGEVDKALWAVEMNQAPYAGFNPEASVCPVGAVPSYVFDEGFESGLGAWDTSDTGLYIYYDDYGNPIGSEYFSWELFYGFATGGEYDLWGRNVNTEGALQAPMVTAVSLPVTTNPLYMRFNHYFSFESGGWDGGILEYSVNGGPWTDANALFVDGQGYNGTITEWVSGGPNPYEGQAAFIEDTRVYVSSRYDLGAFAGSTIKFRWIVATDSWFGASGWDIDDVQIYQCVGSAAPFFSDGFESGDFSAWSRVNYGGGWISTCGEGALNESWGACVERGDNDRRKQLIDETPVNQTTFHTRFGFDPNGLSMLEGERFRFIQTKLLTVRPYYIVMRYLGGEYSIQLAVRTDAGTYTKTGWFVLSDAYHTIEIDWMAASGPGANDGYGQLWIDGGMVDAVTGVDNDTMYVDTLKIGFTSRLEGKSISGIFYLDDVATSNTGYLGLP